MTLLVEGQGSECGFFLGGGEGKAVLQRHCCCDQPSFCPPWTVASIDAGIY